MSIFEIQIRRLAHGHGLDLPAYTTAGAAGMDLLAAVDQPVNIPPLGRALIPTGFAIALPAGYELQIRPRSGLALKHGIAVPNAPGTIDEDYRGEVQVILLNASDEHFLVKRGMRIYAFAEYYLDPFKPYFDTQFTHWVSEGHELRVFAFGS